MADERRLADVGVAEQADIGEQLELEPDRALLAGSAGLGLRRCLIPWGFEVDELNESVL